MDKLPNKHSQVYSPVEVDGEIVYIENPEAERSIEYGVSYPEVVHGKEPYEENYTPAYNQYPAYDFQDPYAGHIPNPMDPQHGTIPQALQQSHDLYHQVPMPDPQGINNPPVYHNQALNLPHQNNLNNQANPPNPAFYNQAQPPNVYPPNPNYNQPQPAYVYSPNPGYNQAHNVYNTGAHYANNAQPIVYQQNIIPTPVNLVAEVEPPALDDNLSIICRNAFFCRYLALGNMLADLLFLISIVYLFLLLGLNILGYFGARLVRRWMCGGYCAYLIVSGLLKLIIIILYPYPYIIVIYLILIGYQGYVLFRHARLLQSIKHLDDNTCSRISHYAKKMRLIKCWKV